MGMRLPKKVNPETKLTNDIAATLRGLGWLVFRFNSGGLPTPRGFVRFGPPGMSDLLCLKAGGLPALFLEVKTPTGRLRASQRDFADRVRGAGHVYAVVRGADDLLAVLRQLTPERGG